MVENSSAAQKPKMPIHVNSPDMCRVSSKVLSHTALVAVVVQHEVESDIEMGNVTQTNLWGLHPLTEHFMAKLTMMLFCGDTFCFLNATVLATFFTAFQSRHPDHEL